MKYDFIEELDIIEKFNPYHDSRGRFTTASNASSFTIRTRGGAYQQNMTRRAIEREKQRTGGKKTAGNGSFKYVKNPEKISTRRQLNEEKKRVRSDIDARHPGADDSKKLNSRDPKERQEQKKKFNAWNDEMQAADKEFRRVETAMSASKKVGKDKKDDVKKLSLLDGVDVNIDDSSIEFSGDTFKHKDAFKAIGAKWNGNSWVISV